MMEAIIGLGGAALQQFGGVVLGIAIGYYGRGMMSSSRTARFRAKVESVWDALTTPRALVVVVGFSFLFSAVGWSISDRQKTEITECFTDSFAQYIASQQPRIEARDERDRALDVVVAAAGDLLDPTTPPDPEIPPLDVAIENFQRLTEEQLKVVEENPYPNPGAECEDIN